ncbi:glutamyl-tRNA amidotransferase B subunit [Phanerochaete sordida]|uniref:Glutamyl-tRNA(Gln) amidotransferase subunit B, mitochondrial n=1 Tax=Phanerochaete sordida TaxID=48140 RepID=A0A9P3FYC9_9APHY|nr:glutamyl-tRNA amidotransferase B subunit [Phanerochaete sordida]
MLVNARRTFRLHRLAHARAIHEHRPLVEDPRWPGWGVVVGIEVHAQIKSRHKLFSNTRNAEPLDLPNTRVSPYDAAFPGTLPRLNASCVELGVRTALALDCKVQPRSTFDRKHYFYADLPSGYQITQHYAPFATDGHLRLSKSDVSVRIKQVQLEQDTGKSMTDRRRRVTSIDLNRAGAGLMEIVSEPDIRSPEEAADYVRTLQALLRAMGSSDGNMEAGSLRCDVNVSVSRLGEGFGTRCEIKNLNSVRFTTIAIGHEINRQIALLEAGEEVVQETRGFDEDRAETFALRSKEDAPDYRYMPDPNLPPLILDQAFISGIKEGIPPLPASTKDRLLELGLSERDVDVLMTIDATIDVGYDGEARRGAVAYFDEVSQGRSPKVVVNWMTNELLGQLTLHHDLHSPTHPFQNNPVSVAQFGELIDLVESKRITGPAGKTILRHIINNSSTATPSALAAELSLLAGEDVDASLKKWCEAAIQALPKEAEVVRRGNKNVVNKLVGHVMKSSRGAADAKAAKSMLEDMLTS